MGLPIPPLPKLPGNASATDKNILGPGVQRAFNEINAIGSRLLVEEAMSKSQAELIIGQQLTIESQAERLRILEEKVASLTPCPDPPDSLPPVPDPPVDEPDTIALSANSVSVVVEEGEDAGPISIGITAEGDDTLDDPTAGPPSLSWVSGVVISGSYPNWSAQLSFDTSALATGSHSATVVFSAVGATNTQTLTINLTVVTAASLVTTYRGRNLPIGMTATVPQSIGDRTTLATPFGGTVWDTADLSVGSARYNAATVLVAVSYAQLMTHLATVAANDLDYIITTPVATLVGVVTLPAKTYPNRHCWIVNTTIHAGTFAHAIGTKVPKSTVGMTILQGPPSAIDAVVEYAQSGNARGYSLHGIVVQIDPSSASYYVQLGIISCRRNTPQVAMSGYSGRLKIDRCWIRGSAIADVRRGILMSGPYLDMQDSRISDVHYRGNESAGIGGWTGAQLHKQINCTIEAGAQTILYGGADPDNPNTNLLDPSDIYTERVYGFKPLTWLTTHPSYAGIHWTVKTGFEAKNVRRWLIDRSWTQNCWPDAQTGFAMLFQNLSDDNSNHLENRIEDVIVRNHKFDYVAMGMNSLSRVAYGGGVTPTHRMTRICYDNILLTRVGGNRADPDSIILNGLSQALGRELQVLGDIDGILIDRITSDGRILFLFSSPGANGQLTNIVGRAGQYGAFLDGGQTGSTAIASYFSDGLVVDGNVAYDISEGILNAGWDGDETNSSMAFQDYDNYNYRLTTQHLNKGVGGSIPGCDIDTLETELSGINT